MEVPCKLLGMVCFYGKHYKAFFNQSVPKEAGASTATSSDSMAWFALDDSKATELGNWQSVVRFCLEGMWRPTLIIYQCSAPALAPPKPVIEAVAPAIIHWPNSERVYAQCDGKCLQSYLR
jgi:hypothetical protein